MFEPELVRFVLAHGLLGDLAVKEGVWLFDYAVSFLEDEEHARVELLLALGTLVDAQLAGLVALIQLLQIAGVDVRGEVATERSVFDHDHVAAVQHGLILVLNAGALQDGDPLHLLGRRVHFLQVELSLLLRPAVRCFFVDAREFMVLRSLLLAGYVFGAVEVLVVVVVLQDDALPLLHVVALFFVVDAGQNVPDCLEGA